MKHLLAVPLLFVTASVVAGGTNHTVVANPDFTFSPSVLNITQGDTVTFINGGGIHNVRADSGPTVFRCANGCDDDGGNGDPAGNAWSVTVSFPSAGLIEFYCELHGQPGQGMAGAINIAVPVELQSFQID